LDKKKARNKYAPNRKIVIYAIIGVVAITAVSAWLVMVDKPTRDLSTSVVPQVEESKQISIDRFQTQFCGTASKPNSNGYISEIRLPSNCEMPLGIVVDTNEGKVWYLSTKNGSLGSYNLREQRFEKERKIPVWPSRENPTDSSQVWTMKVDQHGNIWFTDEKQNSLWKYEPSSDTFETYKIPARSESFGSIYPVSLDFDAIGNLYFVGIRSPTLWFGNTSEMSNNTSQGITEIPLPLQGFEGIDRDLISTGSIVTDNNDKSVWISLLAFGHKGQIIRYDTTEQTFNTYDLPRRLSSPVGIALEDSGNLWVTDHGTSIFFNFLLDNRNITEFVTSKPSERIFGGAEGFSSQAYTLPYWIHKSDDGSLWFNEHTGNKIAHFLPNNNSLIEYWIPSQNILFSQCDPQGVNMCGIANALQLSVGSPSLGATNGNISSSEALKNDEIWFTEWSENKIGRVDSDRNLPFSVQTSPQEITIRKGDTASIDVIITPSTSVSEDRVNMTASATFTPTGDLGNSTWSFSKDSFLLEQNKTEIVKFVLSPSTDLATGSYVLMLGAQDSNIAYLKAVAINIV
jgi:virginiamycin B lyase